MTATYYPYYNLPQNIGDQTLITVVAKDSNKNIVASTNYPQPFSLNGIGAYSLEYVARGPDGLKSGTSTRAIVVR